ncbi:MAG: MFS transporter [Anaerolineaceae bacterium]|nr:MFS transporter [Anaerolineaceae bacterium]
MKGQAQKDLKNNYLVNILDGGFFGFGLGFASFTAILPLFVSHMTNSAILIGLIPAIHSTGWQIPQLFTAQRVSRLKNFKPFVLFMTVHERLPYLGLALVAWFLPSMGTKLALIITFILLIWQGLGAGFTANAWQNLIGKVIPGDYLATFFGMQTAAANLLGSAGAVIAGIILDQYSSPHNFTFCFLITSVLLVVSFYFLSRNRETCRELPLNTENRQDFWKKVRKYLRIDRNFRWFLVTRMLFLFGMMSFAFFIVYAVKYHNMSDITAGLMTGCLFITQVVANPLLGWIADRLGRKGVLEIGALAAMLSSLLAWLAPSLGWFYLVFILDGVANTAFWTIGMAFSMDFGPEEERPTYVGMSNTLIAPATILAPFLAGWLADTRGYPATFAASALMGLLTAVLMHFFVHDTRLSLSLRDRAA